MADDRKNLGKINVAKKILRIEELEDKVRFAVDAYQRAYDKYKRGVDSTQDWNLVIKSLTLQMEEIGEYIAIAHHNKGVVFATNGKLDEAIECFKSAIAMDPEYAIAHNNLSNIYAKIGDVLNAERHKELAKKLGYEPKKKE